MRKFDTEIWTDGNEDAAITVQGGVTDPWEAAKYLSVDDDRAHQINFRHTDHE